MAKTRARGRKAVSPVKQTDTPVAAGTIDWTHLDPATAEQAMVAAMVGGLASNAFAFQVASATVLSNVGTTKAGVIMSALERQGQAVADGDLTGPAKMLASQMVVLNSIFVTYLDKAVRADRLELLEAYMRISQRAQANCRTTAEAITAMTHPPHPAVFAKQANITSGPQQINNAGVSPPLVHARTGETVSSPIKLLESATDGEPHERMERGTANPASKGHSPLEAVEVINRTKVRTRESAGIAQCVQGRHAAKTTRRNAKPLRTAKGAR